MKLGQTTCRIFIAEVQKPSWWSTGLNWQTARIKVSKKLKTRVTIAVAFEVVVQLWISIGICKNKYFVKVHLT